jgi:hypothetical protein
MQALAAEETNPNVRYYDAFVGFDQYTSLFPEDVAKRGWSNQPFPRTSAARAQRQQSMSMAQWFNN